MKKIKIIILLLFAITITACTSNSEAKKFPKKSFSGPFDTVTEFTGYAYSEKEFDKYYNAVKEKMEELHQLYDKYNDYPGINNIKTINDKAGIEPVVVGQQLYDLIEFSITENKNVSQSVNIALGPVLVVWHNYRELAIANGGVGDIPTMAELEAANRLTDINKVILNKEESTVYLQEVGMSLDVGAVAKGYAIEICKDMLIEMGAESFLISGGGNVASHGKRLVPNSSSSTLEACITDFCIGLSSPESGAYANIENIASLAANNLSFVTSGDYQRYFIGKDGKQYHHLIDPTTLFPANYFRAVTVVVEDSGKADFLSTVLFLMSYEDGKEFVEKTEGLEAIWLMNDGTIHSSSGLIEGQNIYYYENENN